MYSKMDGSAGSWKAISEKQFRELPPADNPKPSASQPTAQAQIQFHSTVSTTGTGERERALRGDPRIPECVGDWRPQQKESPMYPIQPTNTTPQRGLCVGRGEGSFAREGHLRLKD